MNILDDEKIYQKLDPKAMLQSIKDLPDQLLAASKQMSELTLPTHYIKVKNIVILGMGGSAIGGSLAASLAAMKIKVPVFVYRDYDLPAFVNHESLVIGTSYSGNTEETVSGFEEAGKRGAKLVAISSDGQIESLCRKFRVPMFKINYGAQPRAALGYLFGAVVGIINKLRFIEQEKDEVEKTVLGMKLLEKDIHSGIPASRNKAKQLAQRIQNKIPVVVGSGTLCEVARRWKTQINENAKQTAFFEQLPELNHNMVVGLEFPEKLSEKLFIVMLQSQFDHKRNKLRQQITLQIFQQQKIQYETIYLPQAETPFMEMMLNIFLGDYVSYYMGILNKIDPTPVETINYLKDRLAASK
jgi:glucose/mannose-6-phosphate isomerase